MEAVLKHFDKDASSYERVPRGDIIYGLEEENGLIKLLLR